jgi:hypothetical protein
MVNIPMYKTYLDYPNNSGIYRILYPVRDSIPAINPYFVILIGFLLVATISSYYTYFGLSGRGRFWNSLLASCFATTVVSILFSLAQLINPYAVLTFIALTVISFAIVIFYK